MDKKIFVHYKPFDFRYSYYTRNSKGFMAYPRKELTDHLLQKDNLALCTVRQIAGTLDNCLIMISEHVMADRSMYSTNGTPYLFPLYLYSQTISENNESQSEKTANFNPEILTQIETSLKLKFALENGKDDEFTALQVLDAPITEYPVAGDNVVGKIKFVPDDDTTGKVYINNSQYFDNVPVLVWEFFIGGYQPAQKWLKDRKDRVLTRHDVRHYGRIIVALSKTAQIMQVIDETLTLV